MKELKLINEIRKRAGKPRKGVKMGIGDDCAVLDFDKERYLLWAVDMLIENTHFTSGAALEKVGRKAVAVNISDIAAMGGVPNYITVSIGVPRRIGLAGIRKIYNGIFRICRGYGIQVVGGDTNRSDKLIVDVSIFGTVEKEYLTPRSGARDNDVIFLTGPVRDGKKSHLDFMPRLKEARYLVSNYKINSMIDVSDGIAMDLGRICSESHAGCELYSGDIPLSKGLTLDDALYYGESFELLFTVPEIVAAKIISGGRRAGGGGIFYPVGRVKTKPKGMNIIYPGGRKEKIKPKGFAHL